MAYKVSGGKTGDHHPPGLNCIIGIIQCGISLAKYLSGADIAQEGHTPRKAQRQRVFRNGQGCWHLLAIDTMTALTIEPLAIFQEDLAE